MKMCVIRTYLRHGHVVLQLAVRAVRHEAHVVLQLPIAHGLLQGLQQQLIVAVASTAHDHQLDVFEVPSACMYSVQL